MDKKNKGFPKGQLIIMAGSGRQASDLTRLYELTLRLQREFEDTKISMLCVGEAGLRANEAGRSLAEAFHKLPLICPEEMITMPDMDFSHLENIILDSLTPISNEEFYNGCYDESGPISKKACKKLAKKQKKLEHKDQKEIWANSWNHKIKRKL